MTILKLRTEDDCTFAEMRANPTFVCLLSHWVRAYSMVAFYREGAATPWLVAKAEPEHISLLCFDVQS